MQKTRILFVVIQLDAGGSEMVVLDLARNLDPEHFEVYIAAFKGGVLEEAFRECCKEVCFVDKKPGFDLAAMLKLSRIISRNRIDVVNAHHYLPLFYSFLGARLLHQRRLVYTEHSVPEVVSIRESFHGRLFHWMLNRINAVIGVSQAITAKFVECYPVHAHKFQTIVNGVDMEKFSCRADSRAAVRGRCGLPEDAFVVGMVANFRRIKNHACLIRAAANLKASCPGLRFLLVGIGHVDDPENSEATIREMIRSGGLEEQVLLAGYQADIPAMLSACDAFCLPSCSEGLPVSILEAMSASVPVIGSNVTGITEVIEDNETGLLFPLDDDRELSRRIHALMDDSSLAERLANSAYDFVSRVHDKRRFHDDYRHIFTDRPMKGTSYHMKGEVL